MIRVVLALFALVLLVRAAAAGEVYDEIKLTDGRVLHHAEIKSDQPATVTILCKEGFISVAKRLLPPALAAKHPGRAPDPSAAPPPPSKPPPTAAPGGRNTGRISFTGCRIVSAQDKNGSADVALENATDRPIQIHARDLLCRTSAGQTFAARYITWVPPGRSLDDPSAPTTVVSGYTHFDLPGGTAATVRVSFFDYDPNAPKFIERVVWAGGH
jgi:hypothetical protein